MASSRGALVTVGQLACYDQAKQLVLGTGLLADNIFTHFLASFIAGGCATFLCQPLDVLKTRLMNSQGEYRGVLHCAVETARLGPLAFYKVIQERWEPQVFINKNIFCHSLFLEVIEEGVKKLFSGGTMASSRGALVTVGQLACYDQAKQLVLGTGLLADNIFTHFLASFIAGGCATFLCQPLDVLKTRLMNSQGEYRGVLHCAVETARLGPLAFYKGLVPAGIRLVPHTVLTFVFLEQLRKYFGIKVMT
ncbi:mitochondrial dicarboxylate carrier-like [Protobothrops mucrosquamatus]|uniref:mitochondrial dicarboxylate carrier-like n=1 Tax=Protobothrops mucrosquamatus TaxID=103944 RepID=UPI0007757C61|nr:mitochondrial dicarboxylate carrier-like [Protobothrops mucrosquamatus]